MANYCLDTNVVSDILRRHPDVIKHMNAALDNDDNLFISSIVYYEVVRGLKAAGKTRMLKEFRELYDNAKHLYLDRDDLTTVKKAVEFIFNFTRDKRLRTMTFTLRRFQWSTAARSSLPTSATSAASKI